MKQAMIFAAGLGTRLKPITEHIPKALVEVGGKPLLEHVLLRMRDAGFEHIVINLHHKADQIVDFLHAKGNFGLDIQLSDERAQLLDTGGGIRHAIPLFDSNLPILIHNVDILSNVDLSNFYEQGTQHDATLLVSQRKTQRYLLVSTFITHHANAANSREQYRACLPYLVVERHFYLSICHSGRNAGSQNPASLFARQAYLVVAQTADVDIISIL